MVVESGASAGFTNWCCFWVFITVVVLQALSYCCDVYCIGAGGEGRCGPSEESDASGGFSLSG